MPESDSQEPDIVKSADNSLVIGTLDSSGEIPAPLREAMETNGLSLNALETTSTIPD
jgi:hypothetical protein